MKDINQIMLQFGESIKQLRLHRDISQEVLSEMIGMPRDTIRRLESGGNVTIRSLFSILISLNRIDWLDSLLPDNLGVLERDRATTKIRQHINLEYKRYNLMYLYNLKLEDYISMFEEQKGICGNPKCNSKLVLTEPDTHVDHCHLTGKVRSLLCSGCNASLGMVKDSEASRP